MSDDTIWIQGVPFPRKDIERIRRFRLLDDTFFAVCFEDGGECTEFLLRVLLDKADLRIVENKTQYSIKNLHGHSVVLDVLAIDSAGVLYDIEMQRTDKGATPKRARYNSSLMDGHILIKGENYEALPETYVIFITENDYFGNDLPLYNVERTVTQTGVTFSDSAHIVYVNASYEGDSPLGNLLHDLRCANPNEIISSVLAERMRYFKEDRKGVTNMCQIMEEVKRESFEEGREEGREEGKREGREEGKREGKREGREEGKREGREEGKREERARVRESSIRKALKMIQDGKLSLEEVSQYTDLSLQEIETLAATV